MQKIDPDTDAIKAVIHLYFTGTYQGDPDQLRQAYHPDVQIFGSIQGKLLLWSLAEFIDRVTKKPTACDKKEKFDKEILLIDVTKDLAMVKARVTAGGLNFTDYITLLKINGRWWIRSKSFTA